MKYFVFLLIFFNLSCISLNKQSETRSMRSAKNITIEDIERFESAFADLGEKRYGSVIPVFESLAKEYKNTDLEWAALYNLASAYKELNQCEKSENIYQNLLKRSKNNPHFKPRIYLLLAYTYECLGEAEKTLIALREGMKNSFSLTQDMKLIEYPARLSLAYFRLGEEEKGKEIQKQLYQNLKSRKKAFRITSATDKNFSRYFYIIGRSYIRPFSVQLNTFLKMIPYHQAYLIQSILLDAGKWSLRAEKELNHLYRKAWETLKKQKDKTPYFSQMKKNLNAIRNIAKNEKNKKIKNIYKSLRNRSNRILSASKTNSL